MYIGIDVGGTSIRIAGFTSLDYPKYDWIKILRTQNDYDRDLAAIFDQIDSPLEGIGVGLPGCLDKDKRTLYISANLNSWVNKPIYKDFEAKFSCPVKLANDSEAAALGEAVYGYGIGKDFLFIIWGTGIGGTAIENLGGRIHLSPLEPGRLQLTPSGPIDRLGIAGSFEAYCGGANLIQRYGKQPKDLNESQWDEVIRDFARGLTVILNIRPVDLIVLGGGVANKQSSRIPKILELIKQTKMAVPPPQQLLLSKYGEEIGVFGALAFLGPHAPAQK
jgi:glucokinase